MIGLLEEIGTIGIDEVSRADDVSVLEGWDDVGILETAVEDGDGDALALIADVVQSLTCHHLYLFLATAVEFSFDAVPGIEGFVIGMFYHLGNGVWRRPHLLASGDTFKTVQTVQHRTVIGTYEYRIVPPRGADDFPLDRISFLASAHLVEFPFDQADVSRIDRQVGGVDGQPLSAATLNTLVRKPSPGVADGIGRPLLVFQCIAPDVVFASRIFPEALARAGGKERHKRCEKYD